jgi:hypothetical protein
MPPCAITCCSISITCADTGPVSPGEMKRGYVQRTIAPLSFPCTLGMCQALGACCWRPSEGLTAAAQRLTAAVSHPYSLQRRHWQALRLPLRAFLAGEDKGYINAARARRNRPARALLAPSGKN